MQFMLLLKLFQWLFIFIIISPYVFFIQFIILVLFSFKTKIQHFFFVINFTILTFSKDRFLFKYFTVA